MYTSASRVRLVLSSTEEDGGLGGTAADLTDPQILLEIEAADALIDANLRVVYTVPFNPIPPLIVSVSTDIAAYGADLNYRSSREYDSQNMPIILRYNRAKETLMQLRTGALTLDYDRTDISEEGALVVHQYDPVMFDPDSVFGYRAGW